MRGCYVIAVVSGALALAACAERGEQPKPQVKSVARELGSDDMPECCQVDPAVLALAATTKPTLAAAPATQPAVALDAPTTAPAASTGLITTEYLAPATRPALDMDWAMVDQDGRSVNLQDFKGKPLVVSFIFTRCPNPNACPLIGMQAANLAGELAKHGLAEKTHIALITYDPVYDTPARLKAWAAQQGITPGSKASQHISLLRIADMKLFPAFLTTYGVKLWMTGDGQVSKHLVEMFLMDGQGRFVRQYVGEVWKNKAVVEDLQRLVDEQTAGQTAAR